MASKEVNDRIMELNHEITKLKQEMYKLSKADAGREVLDHEFTNRLGRKVHLSDLFGDKKELIVVHNMGHTCPWCTMWADGFNGLTRHIESRAGFVISTPDPVSVINSFARERHWEFNMVSTLGTSFKKDFGFEFEDGTVMPGVSTFARTEDGKIHLIGSMFFGPGDDFCATWYFFDLLENSEQDQQ